MNKELRWKLARMILNKSREVKLANKPELQEFSIHSYFQKLGFQRTYEGYEIEETVPWQATPGTEGPHLLYRPEKDHLHFAVTAPTLARNAMVMKIDTETAEKILVMGMP